MYFLKVGQLCKDRLVSEWHIDETVMGKCAHRRQSCALLSATWSACGNEDTDVLAPVATSRPYTASLVPESLPLCREVAVSRRTLSAFVTGPSRACVNTWLECQRGKHRTPL